MSDLSDEQIERIAGEHLTVHMDVDVGETEPHAWVEGELSFARAILRASGVQAQPAPAPQEAPTADEMLDWILRQGEEFSCRILMDQPGDGDYYVTGMDGSGGQGKTGRDAIRAAMSTKETK